MNFWNCRRMGFETDLHKKICKIKNAFITIQYSYLPRERTIEMGIALLGFLASSPVVAITSKPTKA